MNSQMRRSGNLLQLELFSPEPAITAAYDLAQLFDDLNRRHWRGRLPTFRCEWSNRMITTWGVCYRRKQLIRISSIFKSRSLEEVRALLSHEMIHIRYAGHGKGFRKELKRIGLEGDVQRRFPDLVRLTQTLRRSYRYKYKCNRCGVEIERRRKIHGFCAACHHRGIRSRFKLI